MLIAFITCLVATLGAASAWTQAWNAPVGQPNTITSDGVDIFSASSAGLASVDPNGTTLWKILKNCFFINFRVYFYFYLQIFFN